MHSLLKVLKVECLLAALAFTPDERTLSLLVCEGQLRQGWEAGRALQSLCGACFPSSRSRVAAHPCAMQDPLEVVNKYGADALRLYLINSPVVSGSCGW